MMATRIGLLLRQSTCFENFISKAPTPSHTFYRPLSQSASVEAQKQPSKTVPRVLRDVPLPILLRSLVVLSVAALPQSILSVIIKTTKKYSRFISASSALRWPVHSTFYKTFCIGSQKHDIRENIKALRGMGLNGIVLAFARETKIGSPDQDCRLVASDSPLREWVSMNLETLENLTQDDYLALRCTGAGPAAVAALDDFSASLPDSEGYAEKLQRLDIFEDALMEICTEAERRGVRVLVDAESSRHQAGIDHATLSAMAKFNVDNRALIYNTYQMYLKSGTSKMIKHIQISRDQGFTIGIKLVRGAYLHVESDPSALHTSKQNTDDCYDNSVKFLLGGDIGIADMDTASTRPWNADIVLATHNDVSVKKALDLWKAGGTLRKTPNANGGTVQSLSFAQLMGMADEVSLGLVTQRQELTAELVDKASLPEVGVYKYTIWGSFEECLLYMLRRAEENRDAVARTRGTALEVLREVWKRAFPFMS